MTHSLRLEGSFFGLNAVLDPISALAHDLCATGFVLAVEDQPVVASFAGWRGLVALHGGLVAAITQDWLRVVVGVRTEKGAPSRGRVERYRYVIARRLHR